MTLDVNVAHQTDFYLNPERACEVLGSLGIRVSTSRLSVLRCLGGGPEFRKFGKRVFYTREALDSWVASKLSPAFASTSEYPLSRTAVSEVPRNA
jgi:hypothetical protein